MATLAFPIKELRQSTIQMQRARQDTRRVVEYSTADPANFGSVGHIVVKTFLVRRTLAQLSKLQEKIISAVGAADFNRWNSDDLKLLGSQLDKLVAGERELLNNAYRLGSELRIWWGAQLTQIAEQVEHLDSISESLHVAADGETADLLALAAERTATP